MGIFSKKDKNKESKKENEDMIYSVDHSLKKENESVEEFFERAEKENLGKWVDISEEEVFPNLKDIIEKDESHEDNNIEDKEDIKNNEQKTNEIEVKEEDVITEEEIYLNQLFLLWMKLKERFEINKYAELSAFLALKTAEKYLKNEKEISVKDNSSLRSFKLLNFNDSLDEIKEDIKEINSFEIKFKNKNRVSVLLDEVEFFLDY